MRIRTALALALAAVLFGLAFQGVSAGNEPRAPKPVSHIVLIVMENKEFGSVLGPTGEATYLKSLAARSVTLTSLYAITHPSLPNYLAMTSGSTHGISSDCTTCFVNGSNIVDQLEAASVTWKAYMEDFPGGCFSGGSAGAYAKKHNPFLYYNDIRVNPTRCRHVVRLRQLRADLAAGTLPQFSWITPNICNDMHDCPVTTGDGWLKAWVPKIMAGLGSDGVVIVVFDEGVTSAACCDGRASGGHIAGVIAGPGAARHVRVTAAVDQYSILRLIEDNWGLSHLGGAATAPVVSGWRAPTA